MLQNLATNYTDIIIISRIVCTIVMCASFSWSNAGTTPSFLHVEYCNSAEPWQNPISYINVEWLHAALIKLLLVYEP